MLDELMCLVMANLNSLKLLYEIEYLDEPIPGVRNDFMTSYTCSHIIGKGIEYILESPHSSCSEFVKCDVIIYENEKELREYQDSDGGCERLLTNDKDGKIVDDGWMTKGFDFIPETYISFELLFNATTSIEPAPKPLLASTMSAPTDETQQKTPGPLFTVYEIPYWSRKTGYDTGYTDNPGIYWTARKIPYCNRPSAVPEKLEVTATQLKRLKGLDKGSEPLKNRQRELLFCFKNWPKDAIDYLGYEEHDENYEVSEDQWATGGLLEFLGDVLFY
ncbi:uncharacterized protein J4E78_009051 [Alternaria triticimaculans]|uniref:uncharacterized protein n=1 Tax=Alternaria triticimaculans TaxID=297637 RepID=UPI0020C51CB2|nr:uncharacterized protein J4E78_009051 [Alternaria triticimaculans]KAI4647078.1 hypothetical protein J4E78_009051 [Alternaria triticimaculans]